MRKKGVSVMIGYILLVVFAIVIGAIVFQWLRTYVPTESLGCPDGTSLAINDATFNPASSELSVKLRNNGRFSLLGYFIHGTNESNEELPTIDLSGYFPDDKNNGESQGGSIFFDGSGTNPFSSGSSVTHVFEISSGELDGGVKRISILPRRQQEVDGARKSVSCGNARVIRDVEEVE